MIIRLLLPLILFAVIPSHSYSQRVVRKGVTPVRVQKPMKNISYNLGQFTGKWQEYSRRSVSNNGAMDFKDTVMLNFNKRDSVYVYDGITMSQRGVVSIEAPASLTVAGDVYSIVSMSKSAMVLNDGEYLREFRKTKSFYHETLGKLKANIESHEKPLAISAAKLTGRWDIYRRQAKPGTADSILVKSITFTSTADSLAGTISYYSTGTTSTEKFSGSISGTTLTVHTAKKHWTWDTFKADREEFVFGLDKEIIYYAKKL